MTTSSKVHSDVTVITGSNTTKSATFSIVDTNVSALTHLDGVSATAPTHINCIWIAREGKTLKAQFDVGTNATNISGEWVYTKGGADYRGDMSINGTILDFDVTAAMENQSVACTIQYTQSRSKTVKVTVRPKSSSGGTSWPT